MLGNGVGGHGRNARRMGRRQLAQDAADNEKEKEKTQPFLYFETSCLVLLSFQCTYTVYV